MSAVDNTSAHRSTVPDSVNLPIGSKGPVTASRHRRNAVVYAVLFVLGLLPTWLDAGAAWRAAGLGLLMPGAGFLSDGGWLCLLFPLTVALFFLSLIAWFWCGMVVAPLGVWLGTALLAGLLAQGHAWGPAAYLAPAAAAAAFAFFQYRGMRRQAKDQAHYGLRQTFFAGSLAEVGQRVLSEPQAGERELTPDQLGALRYCLDRALQPVGQFKGYTVIDQFQPAALRYQINHLGYALAMAQGHYTPSFQGYLSQAQRNLIEAYLQRRVWGYWVYESMWGHFNFTDFDPAGKDNIMLTGYFGMQVGQYMLNSGDRRYAEPGSLTFRLNQRTAYRHDLHSVVGSVVANQGRSDFCLFPCEPNWIYAVCNMYGMGALAVHDRVFGTRYVPSVLPQWMQRLESEFTDAKGSLVALRSYWTGLRMPFYAGEAGFAFYANVFAPALARRLWAVGRKELSFCLAKDAQGDTRLTLPPEALSWLDTIDPGNYRPGLLFAYAAVLICAREFGDDELAQAAQRSMDQDCGRIVDNGSVWYTGGSGWANIAAVEGKLMRTGDFRNSFVKGPPESVFKGPYLEQARYPEVLVAKAFSRGEDLELVLYPGAAHGRQSIGIARLKPDAAYRVQGDQPGTLRADAAGQATLDVDLRGRTALHLVPAA
ncbi:MAG: hypothetical protein ISP90_05090 [Nevskia sp.]|nr:hypothetical protein [Nevskia sp.]